MGLAGSPSLREIRAAAKARLEAATITGSPTIVDTPVNPVDANDLPEIHLFDGGRNSASNTAAKLYKGRATLSLGVEITVEMKSGYADQLDILTDQVLQLLLTSDNVQDCIGNILSYNTVPSFDRAETPLARNVITVNMSAQETFKAVDQGNPAPLTDVVVDLEISNDANENNEFTFNPPQ